MYIQFIIFNVLNVVIQTIKSIATIKCGKTVAAVVNAVAYGLYTYIVVLMTDDTIPLYFRVCAVAIANLIGVFVVKYFEEKGRKDKLWKVEATVYKSYTENLHKLLQLRHISHNYIEGVGQYVVFNIYCETQKQSQIAKILLEENNAKYFVSESKTL